VSFFPTKTLLPEHNYVNDCLCCFYKINICIYILKPCDIFNRKLVSTSFPENCVLVSSGAFSLLDEMFEAKLISSFAGLQCGLVVLSSEIAQKYIMFTLSMCVTLSD